MVCDEHSEERRAPALAAEAAAGRRSCSSPTRACPASPIPAASWCALVLEAGAPLTVLPGPGAVETALVASGLAADRYEFRGWVPRATAPRQRLPRRGRRRGASGRRVRVAATRGRDARGARRAWRPTTRCALCRELTKLYEEVVRGTAAEVAGRVAGRELRGEVAIVISGSAPADTPAEAAAAFAAVAELVEAGVGARQASSLVARLTGQPRRALYDAAVATRREYGGSYDAPRADEQLLHHHADLLRERGAAPGPRVHDDRRRRRQRGTRASAARTRSS